MLISTILLIANLAMLILKERTLFSFLHFIWIYPLEIIIYLIIFVIIVLIGDR